MSCAPPQSDPKPSSRFSTLNVFKLKPGSGPSSLDTAPPLPPKDTSLASPNRSLSPPSSAFYKRSLFSRSATSLSPSLSPDSNSGPVTPPTPNPPIPSAFLESAKRTNGALSNTNARTMAASPAPSASGASLASLHRSGRDYLPSPSMDESTDSSGSCPNISPNPSANLGPYSLNSASSSTYALSVKSKKGLSKLAHLAKRNRSKKDLSDTASTFGSASKVTSLSEHEDVEGDEEISLPWNFQHHIHVDEGYIGLPPSWSAVLSQVGFDEVEIATIHARRRAAANALASSTRLNNASPTERPVSPYAPTMSTPTTTTSSSTTLLQPLPRSTSLGRRHATPRIHPPSIYLVATSTSSGPPDTIRGPNTAPSLRTPSFSVRSFVSGIKNSLTSDLASAKGLDSSNRVEGATAEESEQYVFVDGDSPDQGGDQGMGDETLIEPYPFDTSNVFSHRTNTLRIQPMSQGQQTSRKPTLPQIQVECVQSDAGYSPSPTSTPTSTSRAPSPLVHSKTLPIPNPTRACASPDYSPSTSLSCPQSPADPGLQSAPPPMPSRRIYHIVNASSDSCDAKYVEPPPAYVSSRVEGWAPRKEKEFGVSRSLPNRPIPPIPTQGLLGQLPRMSNHGSEEEVQTMSMPENTDTTTRPIVGISRTADQVVDISPYYSSDAVHEVPRLDPIQPGKSLGSTLSSGIDDMAKLAVLPPRVSLHQEGSLEDWSESLFSAIGGKGKRSSVLMAPRGRDAASVKGGTTTRPLSPLSMTGLSMTGGGISAEAMASNCLSPESASLPDNSEPNSTLGPHVGGSMDVVEEGDEQDQAKDETQETKDGPKDDGGKQAVDADTTTTGEAEVKEVDGSAVAPSTPFYPVVSSAPGISSTAQDPDPPAVTSSLPSELQHRSSLDSLPPSPPPKPRPKLTPLALPSATLSLPLPKTNVITGITRKSPASPLFGATPTPLPLPIPIPLSQIRAQLRPAPPKSPHPSHTLPSPAAKRPPLQLNLQPPQLQLPLVPFQTDPERNATTSHASLSDSRSNSSQALTPSRASPGDRDSGMSTITVTPATIRTAKTEVVRTAIANFIDSDTVSSVSGRDSVVSTEPQILVYNKPNRGEESSCTQKQGGAPDDCLLSETSSVSLLHDDPQSKWPAPPATPVEMEMDVTLRRMSKFRVTSVGRITQLQAMGNMAASPIDSHFSHGSDTASSSTSESTPLVTPKGVNGLCPSMALMAKGGLAPEARMLNSTTNTFGGVDVESEGREESETCWYPSQVLHASTPPSMHPLLSQLQPYITHRNPVSCFADLVEIAEGESGSVFAARITSSFVDAGSRQGKQESMERPIPSGTSHVAIKRIPLPPLASLPSLSDDSPISNKLISVVHELCLLKGLDHEHLLLFDGAYVSSNLAQDEDAGSASAVDTSLWLRMELMERSLADVIALVAEGLTLQERLIGRFANDVLHGLSYLQRQCIAHRDVRSDNLLVNAAGVVKLADFSNAVRVDRNAPAVNGAVGVIYWQAPEMRTGPYNALKVDIWSLGATVWELAETVPPFSIPVPPSTQVSFGSQWPPLAHPEHYSRAFHEFLRHCGRESAGRPGPGELLNTPFIRNACGRAVILQLLSQCRAIEESMVAKEASVDCS